MIRVGESTTIQMLAFQHQSYRSTEIITRQAMHLHEGRFSVIRKEKSCLFLRFRQE